MNRGLAEQQMCTDRSGRELFFDLMGECHEMKGMQVTSYSLMDHYDHRRLPTPQGNLSRVMRHLDGLDTQRSASTPFMRQDMESMRIVHTWRISQ